MPTDIKERKRGVLSKNQKRKGLHLRRHLRNKYAKDLRTPKYKMRRVPDKRKKKLTKITDDEISIDDGKTYDGSETNVKAFTSKKGKAKQMSPDDITREEVLEHGLETFAKELASGGRGFFALIFNEDGYPSIIWAGDMDLMTSVGALEIAKNELFKNIFSE